MKKPKVQETPKPSALKTTFLNNKVGVGIYSGFRHEAKKGATIAMTAADARSLAQQLIELADKVDNWIVEHATEPTGPTQ